MFPAVDLAPAIGHMSAASSKGQFLLSALEVLTEQLTPLVPKVSSLIVILGTHFALEGCHSEHPCFPAV